MDGDILGLIAIALAIGLGFIPANIAKRKGYGNYFLWWLYGAALFIVAIIHVSTLKDKNPQEPQTASVTDPANELKKYKELLDLGAISQEEYNEKKSQLLK